MDPAVSQRRHYPRRGGGGQGKGSPHCPAATHPSWCVSSVSSSSAIISSCCATVQRTNARTTPPVRPQPAAREKKKREGRTHGDAGPARRRRTRRRRRACGGLPSRCSRWRLGGWSAAKGPGYKSRLVRVNTEYFKKHRPTKQVTWPSIPVGRGLGRRALARRPSRGGRRARLAPAAGMVARVSGLPFPRLARNPSEAGGRRRRRTSPGRRRRRQWRRWRRSWRACAPRRLRGHHPPRP